MKYEWDEAKAEENSRKHGVSFFEAIETLENSLSYTFYDREHSEAEDRYVSIGFSANGRTLVVVHTERNEWVRIISARPATQREIRDYEDGTFSE